MAVARPPDEAYQRDHRQDHREHDAEDNPEEIALNQFEDEPDQQAHRGGAHKGPSHPGIRALGDLVSLADDFVPALLFGLLGVLVLGHVRPSCDHPDSSR